MKTQTLSTSAKALFRAPTPSDGQIFYQLAKAAGTLDVNSEYAYLLPGLHHADASVLAEVDGCPAGFVSGYLIPKKQEAKVSFLGGCLFVWQVGVHPDYRKQGLARAMLLELVSRSQNKAVHFVETTISPSNTASKKLFESLAAALGTRMEAVATLDAKLFSSPHEEETVYRIGPFNPADLLTKRKNDDAD